MAPSNSVNARRLLRRPGIVPPIPRCGLRGLDPGDAAPGVLLVGSHQVARHPV